MNLTGKKSSSVKSKEVENPTIATLADLMQENAKLRRELQQLKREKGELETVNLQLIGQKTKKITPDQLWAVVLKSHSHLANWLSHGKYLRCIRQTDLELLVMQINSL